MLKAESTGSSLRLPARPGSLMAGGGPSSAASSGRFVSSLLMTPAPAPFAAAGGPAAPALPASGLSFGSRVGEGEPWAYGLGRPEAGPRSGAACCGRLRVVIGASFAGRRVVVVSDGTPPSLRAAAPPPGSRPPPPPAPAPAGLSPAALSAAALSLPVRFAAVAKRPLLPAPPLPGLVPPFAMFSRLTLGGVRGGSRCFATSATRASTCDSVSCRKSSWRSVATLCRSSGFFSSMHRMSARHLAE
mmetsp:Transcript_13299/g.43809  ORF Transcript_13299/g.43809 Transcript_13299/m.43809 type:complete len:245 (+) Transcript_13299:1167-1901(+)